MQPIITRDAAKASGLPRYFTGKPCKHGHLAPRYTSSTTCVICQHAATQALRAKNPERTRRQNAETRERTREKRNAYHREWMKRNPEKNRANVARWKRANPDKVSALSAAYHARNAERLNARRRAYRKNNPHVGAASSRRRRAKLRGAEGSDTAAEILALAQKQNYRCACCGVSIRRGYHADHITPLAKGGSDWITNIQLLCAKCNKRKAAKDPLAWAAENGLLL
ncbi:HNH endonuclease [Burkholderia multivorans]|uniref:HNH endonuclease n=1 Tax=Burkholderia multivorans TaxID=87883 RepID=UPI0021C033D7|nr:HNH endonuclease signature motif containing protein [Burkholderia multivorans]